VVVKAKATLDYADHRPRITGIDATARFAGAGLVVDAVSGSVRRADPARGDIPDLGAWNPQLHQRQAGGPTADFVRFVGSGGSGSPRRDCRRAAAVGSISASTSKRARRATITSLASSRSSIRICGSRRASVEQGERQFAFTESS
jgi:hypothetical protein